MSTLETAQSAPIAAIAITNRLSIQMCAAITIFAADHGLYDVVSPFVNLAEGSVNWEGIFGLTLCSGHRAIVDWAYVCFHDQIREGNPFDTILTVDPVFKKAIARALSIRWGVAK